MKSFIDAAKICNIHISPSNNLQEIINKHHLIWEDIQHPFDGITMFFGYVSGFMQSNLCFDSNVATFCDMAESSNEDNFNYIIINMCNMPNAFIYPTKEEDNISPILDRIGKLKAFL
jgi:hypothetical protein